MSGRNFGRFVGRGGRGGDRGRGGFPRGNNHGSRGFRGGGDPGLFRGGNQTGSNNGNRGSFSNRGRGGGDNGGSPRGYTGAHGAGRAGGRGAVRGNPGGGGDNRGDRRGSGGGDRGGRGGARGDRGGRGGARGDRGGRGSARGDRGGGGSTRGDRGGRGSTRGDRGGRGSTRGDRGGRGSTRGDRGGRTEEAENDPIFREIPEGLKLRVTYKKVPNMEDAKKILSFHSLSTQQPTGKNSNPKAFILLFKDFESLESAKAKLDDDPDVETTDYMGIKSSEKQTHSVENRQLFMKFDSILDEVTVKGLDSRIEDVKFLKDRTTVLALFSSAEVAVSAGQLLSTKTGTSGLLMIQESLGMQFHSAITSGILPDHVVIRDVPKIATIKDIAEAFPDAIGLVLYNATFPASSYCHASLKFGKAQLVKDILSKTDMKILGKKVYAIPAHSSHFQDFPKLGRDSSDDEESDAGPPSKKFKHDVEDYNSEEEKKTEVDEYDDDYESQSDEEESDDGESQSEEGGSDDGESGEGTEVDEEVGDDDDDDLEEEEEKENGDEGAEVELVDVMDLDEEGGNPQILSPIIC